MGAWITIGMSVDLSARPGTAGKLAELVDATAGTADVVADATQNTLTFRMQYPGNLSAIVKRMRQMELVVPSTVEIALPVRSLAIPGKVTVAEDVLHELNEPPSLIPRTDSTPLTTGEGIMDARFENGNLHASIVPTSASIRLIWDVLLEHGLMAQDTPTLVALRHITA